jgi:hypothetical protein
MLGLEEDYEKVEEAALMGTIYKTIYIIRIKTN